MYPSAGLKKKASTRYYKLSDNNDKINHTNKNYDESNQSFSNNDSDHDDHDTINKIMSRLSVM